MMALVLLLASLSCLGGQPARAQKGGKDQGFKVYERSEKIYMSDLDGSGERKLAEGYSPALSPDRIHLAFGRNWNLYLLDLGTMEEEILVEYDENGLNRGAFFPQWHPNGRTIFFNMANGFLVDLYSIDIDGTNIRSVVEGGGLYYSWPNSFSPDGRKLLYSDCHDECYTLLVLDLDRSTHTCLSKRTDYGAWSPNGRHIAFGDVWGPGLFVADSGGWEVRQILENVDVGALSWSGDSTRIAFTRRDEGATGASGTIFEVGLDGTGLQSREAHFDAWDYSPDSTTAVVPTLDERTWGQIKEDSRLRMSLPTGS